jgi:hypothetical protein
MTGQKILETFDDFNDASRMTLFQARFAVAELGGEVITPAHLVLGLLGTTCQPRGEIPDGLAARRWSYCRR